MRDEIRAVGGGRCAGCWCTHTCWMLSSMKFSPRKIAYEVPSRFIEAKRMRNPRLDPAKINLADIERRYGLRSA